MYMNTETDTDTDKLVKKKIINICGTKYEIKHKINSNKCNICIGLSILCCKQLFRKCLVSIGIFMLIFLIIWEYMDRIILLCMYDSAECPIIYIGCNNLSYFDEYVCVRNSNFFNLLMLSINNIWCLFIYSLFLMFCVYLAIVCFNYSICRYIEHLPTIENIL
jgi:hypothetical protein